MIFVNDNGIKALKSKSNFTINQPRNKIIFKYFQCCAPECILNAKSVPPVWNVLPSRLRVDWLNIIKQAIFYELIFWVIMIFFLIFWAHRTLFSLPSSQINLGFVTSNFKHRKNEILVDTVQCNALRILEFTMFQVVRQRMESCHGRIKALWFFGFDVFGFKELTRQQVSGVSTVLAVY